MTSREINQKLNELKKEYRELLYEMALIGIFSYDYLGEESLEEEIEDAFESGDLTHGDMTMIGYFEDVLYCYLNLMNSLSMVESGNESSVHNGKKNLEEILSTARNVLNDMRIKIESIQHIKGLMEEAVRSIEMARG